MSKSSPMTGSRSLSPALLTSINLFLQRAVLGTTRLLTGLADGLARKEPRYALNSVGRNQIALRWPVRSDSPPLKTPGKSFSIWVPRVIGFCLLARMGAVLQDPTSADTGAGC